MLPNTEARDLVPPSEAMVKRKHTHFQSGTHWKLLNLLRRKAYTTLPPRAREGKKGAVSSPVSGPQLKVFR